MTDTLIDRRDLAFQLYEVLACAHEYAELTRGQQPLDTTPTARNEFEASEEAGLQDSICFASK